jgi:hypothetical protein
MGKVQKPSNSKYSNCLRVKHPVFVSGQEMDFSLLHRLWGRTWVHAAPYLTGKRALSPGVETSHSYLGPVIEMRGPKRIP